MRTGTRVQLHPATDAWMRGDRYGVVIKLGRSKFWANDWKNSDARVWHVKLDKSGKTIRIGEQLLIEV